MRTTAVCIALVLLIALAILGMAYANPIPTPTLIIEHEKISICLKKHGDSLLVNVKGEYPFRNAGYRNVTMYFPIPREALSGNVSILVNKEPVSYTVVEEMVIDGKPKKYETVLGPLPLLKWVIEDISKDFTVEVWYSYSVDMEDEWYTTIYALGTGRFYYSKQCTADITISFLGLKDHYAFITLAPPREELGKTTFRLRIEKNAYTVELTEVGAMFKGLNRDLIIKVVRAGPQITTTPLPGSPGEGWIEGYPMSVDVEVEPLNGKVNLTVTMVFKHAGYKVEWGSALIDLENRRINIHTRVWEWTGPSAQVVTRKSHNYTLTLRPESYTVVIYINDNPAYKEVITVGSQEESSMGRPTHPMLTSMALVCVAFVAALGITIMLLRQRTS